MKRTKGDKIFDLFNITFLGICGLITLFPFWNVIAVSFVGEAEYYANTFILWPQDFKLTAYRYLFGTKWVYTGFQISALVTVLGTVFDIFLVSTAAYVLAFKRNLPGRKFFTTYFLITMYFGGGLIPYYLVVAKFLGLYNNVASMIITSGLNVWCFMVLRTFFREIPESLPESAKMDGASEYKILFKIILPLSLPAIATLVLFQAVVHWNEWFKAILFIDDNYKQPLQIVLRKIVIDQRNSTAMRNVMDKAYQNLLGGTTDAVFHEGVKSAIISVVTVPIILVYPFLQKYFAKGVMVGSIKG